MYLPSSGSLKVSFFLLPVLSVLFLGSGFLSSLAGFLSLSEWSTDGFRLLACFEDFFEVPDASLSESDDEEEDLAGENNQSKYHKFVKYLLA